MQALRVSGLESADPDSALLGVLGKVPLIVSLPGRLPLPFSCGVEEIITPGARVLFE